VKRKTLSNLKSRQGIKKPVDLNGQPFSTWKDRNGRRGYEKGLPVGVKPGADNAGHLLRDLNIKRKRGFLPFELGSR